jgi:hypothetical protein
MGIPVSRGCRAAIMCRSLRRVNGIPPRRQRQIAIGQSKLSDASTTSDFIYFEIGDTC